MAKPLSNGFGILGLYFACLESYLVNVVDLPGVPDTINSAVAGGWGMGGGGGGG